MSNYNDGDDGDDGGGLFTTLRPPEQATDKKKLTLIVPIVLILLNIVLLAICFCCCPNRLCCPAGGAAGGAAYLGGASHANPMYDATGGASNSSGTAETSRAGALSNATYEGLAAVSDAESGGGGGSHGLAMNNGTYDEIIRLAEDSDGDLDI